MFRTIQTTLFAVTATLGSTAFSTAQNPPDPDAGNWRGPCYNCYNYALNRKDWFFAQTIDVTAPNKIECANTKAAAIVDGLAPAAWPGPPAAQPAGWPAGACPPGHSLVALAVIPGGLVDQVRKTPGKQFAKPTNAAYVGDFHWYRLNGDGTAANSHVWSHKQGQTPATTKDGKGRVMNAALPPHLADLGPYEFCCYMCVPNPPAALGPVDGSTPWTFEQLVKAWTLREAGVEDVRQDILDLQQTMQHMPSLLPVPDPLWPDWGMPRGFGIMLPPSPTLPQYIRVFDGVVAFYQDIDGMLPIQYFADDNGLEEFLILQFDDIEVEFYGGGCDTQFGELTTTMVGGDARIGGFIDLEIGRYDPLFPAACHLGVQQIEIPLTILGLAPDCSLYTNPILTLPIGGDPLLPGGHSGLPLPPDPGLGGLTLHFQGLVVDPTVPGSIATSQGLAVTLR
ncbi:MAG: hypothetical protein KDB80_09475 [Planctomycetes bacterium]|nr:hypothetical protein [Planctomycetota bacterium]